MNKTSKVIINGNAYHVCAGTVRELAESRDALLEALREILSEAQWDTGLIENVRDIARAALAKAVQS